MSCAGSERAENKKGFDCENMGEVLGKECVKDESFTHSSEESIREVGKGSGSSIETSGIEFDQDTCEDSDDDISWLLSFNKDELVTEKCKCEGCLRRNESCNDKKNNAKLLLSSWKELQSYIRNVYINSPLESAQRTVPIKENERLYEMIQIMRLCDPYQLFLKIEEEVQAMVMRSRNRQLSLLKHEFDPDLAGEFITGLIEEYVKLLSSALQLGPAIDILLMSQFQRFGLSWDMLNKHLYQSLVYNHSDVQNYLPRCISHLTVIPYKGDVYLELVHQYLAFDDEMASIAEAWEKIEPVIQEFKISKLREMETLNSLQDALKAFCASRPTSVNRIDVSDSAKKNSRYCPNCLTMRGCPCDECTVTHMLTCEGMESPPVSNSPIAGSRTPNKDKQAENKEDVNGDQQQSCECHACAAPPPELMDCSVTFNQINSKNSPREGFQLYPHIHGTVTESIYEADNISSIYSNLQATQDNVYPHLYNLQSQTNSVVNVSQINLSGVIPNRSQPAQPVQPVQSAQSVQPVQPILSVQPLQSPKTVQSAKTAQPVQSPQPAQPVQTTKPTKSTQSTQSTKSTQSTQSTKPTQSTQSTKPTQSTQSAQSTQSTKPTQSTQSAQSTKPTVSTQSTKPTQSTESAKSAKSAQPVQPVQPVQPIQSAKSTKSTQSTQSAQSAKPAQSTQSTQSTQSAKPAQPVKSAKSAQTIQTAQPVSVKKIQPASATSTQHEKGRVVTSVSVNTQSQLLNCPPPLPPPSQNAPSSTKSVAPKDKANDKATMTNITVKPVQPKQMPTAIKSDSNKRSNIDSNKSGTVKVDDKKNQPTSRVASAKENEGAVKAGAEKAKLLSNTTCVKSSLCGKCCLRHGPNCLKTPSCGKSTDKHLAAIARLGYSTTINARGTLRGMPGKDSDHTHRPGKSHSCGKLKTHEIGRRVVNGKLNAQEPDDSSSQDDTCSERSNSTSASTQRDTRHCDCCYCEVFGHGVPQVAPVSRNYQEMRERLRLKLNMKKSAKSKSGQQGSEAGTAPGTANSQDVGKKNAPKEKDLESLLKFIEGKTREACKDPKRLAKRARQKQKKLEEKERMEEEAERKRVEAMKKAQAAKQNQSQQSGKQQQHPNSKNAPNNNNSKNRSNTSTSNNNQSRNNQALNLSGLKSLVEKSDPNSGPKMVTIRRVMAPFSAEPTVTITLKGSTPDKDKVLFMLKNGSEAYQPEENSKKGKKNKKKAKKEVEYYEEEEDAELLYEEEPEPVMEKAGSKKKKKNKNKNAEVVENNVKSLRSVNQPESSKGTMAETNKNSKNKNSKSNSSISTSNTVKTPIQAVNKSKSSNTNVSVKSSQNSSSTQVSNSKGKSPKNVPVLKSQNQNVKNRDNSNNKTSSKNASSTKNSGRNNNNNNNNISNSNSVNSKNSSSAKVSARNSNVANNVNVTTKSSKNNQKLSAVSGANEKSVVNQSGKNQVANAKQSKNKKSEEISQRQGPTMQTKGKVNDPKSKTVQKVGKSANESVQKAQPRQEVKQNVQRKEKQKENVKTIKNSQKTVMENRDMNARFSMGGGYERGKVVINTPSYRLSEVLSSIAPSPPPKEEINLENLRLPPGITITKIEGPITKSVRANDQPPHVSKPVPSTPPIVVSTPTLKPSHTTPPGNVIVVDTGRLKEVIQENSPNPPPTQSTTTSKRKKKKNKQNAENMVPTMEVPMSQNSKYEMKLNKSNPVMGKSGVTVISPDEARKMVPNLENQQATIIKTSDNMVTIRSPAFQQAMNMQAYQNSSNFRPGVNGYNNVTLFQNDVNRITDSIGKFSLNPEDKLARQMRNLNIKEGSRAGEIFAQAMSVAGQNGQDPAKKKKKKRKSGSNRSDEKEVEPVESVFQPKDIDLENGDIDDDERELEAFKRFCLQSVPSERKNKVKVNLNIKDIVLKKKSSAIGCS